MKVTVPHVNLKPSETEDCRRCAISDLDEKKRLFLGFDWLVKQLVN